MIQRYTILLLFVFLVMFAPEVLRAEEKEAPVDMARSLYVVMRTLMDDGSEDTGYISSLARFTFPGRPVRINMNTNDGKLVILLTPYLASGEMFYLVTESRIYLKDLKHDSSDHEQGNPDQFTASFSNMPLKYGEWVTLYPLGTPEGKKAHLRMDILIVPYTWIAREGDTLDSLVLENLKLFPLQRPLLKVGH